MPLWGKAEGQSSYKRRLRRDLIGIYLKRGYKEEQHKLLRGAQWENKRQQLKVAARDILTEYKEKGFHHESD